LCKDLNNIIGCWREFLNVRFEFRIFSMSRQNDYSRNVLTFKEVNKLLFSIFESKPWLKYAYPGDVYLLSWIGVFSSL